MNDVLRMELADCGSPDRLISAISSAYPDLPRKVPIEDLAREVGIVEFRQLEAEGFEGALLTDPNKTQGVILTKTGSHPRRRRFTVGHELGHFLIPTHRGNQQCTVADMRETRRDNDYRRREAEANRFSAGMLMPKPMFVKDMAALGSADVSHAVELSDLYDTSLEATVNRYAELTRDACAFVFSTDEIIRYARPSRDFPKMGVRNGESLPAYCATLKASAVRKPTDWTEQRGAMWLEAEWGKSTPTVLEQSVLQANGYRITLLYIDEGESEAEEEEEDIEDRWKVGFRR